MIHSRFYWVFWGCGALGSVLEQSQDSPRDRAPGSRRAAFVDRAFRLWRVLGTGLSFVVFGVAALGLALLVFPLCHLAGGDVQLKQARVQRVIHHAHRFFVALMETLGLIRTDWSGAERLLGPGPQLVVANHPTLIDIVHVISRLPQADCVIGGHYAHNPFLGLAASWAGYITNAHGAAVVDACAERLRAGRTVVLFPEGTRSPRNGMHPFRRGAAHIAVRAGVSLVPVAISCVPSMLRKGQPWWDVPERPSRFRIYVLDPIELPATGASDVLVARRLTATLRERIIERLNRVEPR